MAVPMVLLYLARVEKPFRNILIALLLTAASVLAVASPAGAQDIVRTDGNDTKGPLDLASVRLTPLKDHLERFAMSTFSAFSASQLDGTRGWIEVDFDTNADRQYDFWVTVFYYRGSLRAFMGRNRHVIRKIHLVRRANKKTVSFDLDRRMLGKIHSYDFAAFSVWSGAPCSRRHPCVDGVPNRYPLLRRDFTAPAITWGSVPTLSTDVSAGLGFDVGFSIKDDPHGSGVASWTLQQGQGGGSWTTAATGHSTVVTQQVTGAEGEITALRVVAVDKQGNKRTSSIKRIVVPWDDRNGSFQYSTIPTTDAPSGAFRSTTSAMAMTDTVSITVPAGSDVCVLGGPTTGPDATATLSYGSTSVTLTETAGTSFLNANAMCGGAATSGNTDVTIEVTSAEPFVLDGLVLKR